MLSKTIENLNLTRTKLAQARNQLLHQHLRRRGPSAHTDTLPTLQ
jgi:hypothetical protein